MDYIDSIDKLLIVAWHEGWHPAWLDSIVPWWRQKETWIAFYVLLILWLIWDRKLKGLYLAGLTAATVGLADFAAAGIIKPLVGRLRPCNSTEIQDHLDLLTGCGPGLSFPSAHASNHFALAIFLSLTIFKSKRWVQWVLVFWAASIAIGQVYVGRHYFSDIIVGAILGSSIGYLGAFIAEKFRLLDQK